jgi:hypothetical protein
MKQLHNYHSRQYLILDYNHLFVSSSLREEIWLLRRKNDAAILTQVLAAAQAFGIRNASADRALNTYSGGEQAILACMLIVAFVEVNQLSGLKLLLISVLESLSRSNRSSILKILHDLGRTHALTVFCAKGRHIEELYYPDEN